MTPVGRRIAFAGAWVEIHREELERDGWALAPVAVLDDTPTACRKIELRTREVAAEPAAAADGTSLILSGSFESRG
jgi:hypothetical protein